MSTLILALPTAHAAPEQASGAWAGPSSGASSAGVVGFVLTPDGQQIGPHGQAPLAQLPAAQEVVALVPPQCLSWHQVSVPRAPAAKLRAALASLLEERLLDDIDTLHLALAPTAQAGETAWVCACDRAWLQGWLAQLEAAGRPVDRIAPQFAPLPVRTEGGTPQHHLLGPADAPLHVLTDTQGVHLRAWSTADAGAARADAAQPLDEGDAPGPWMVEPAVAALAERALGQRVHLLPPAHRWLAAARSDWDLAQFELRRSGGRLGRAGLALGHRLWSQPAWRPLRWGVVGLLLVHLVGLNVWAWSERASWAKSQAQANQLLQSAFPQVRTVIDAHAQMQREVSALQRTSGSLAPHDLEPLLSAVAGGLSADWSAAQLEFSPGQLQLRGPTLDAARQRALQAALAAKGYSVRIEGDRIGVQSDHER